MNKWVNPPPRRLRKEAAFSSQDARNYTSSISFNTIKEQVGKKTIFGKQNRTKKERIMEVVERLLNNIRSD